MKDRKKIKETRKEVQTVEEEKLDSRNCYGNNDPTPKRAVKNIIQEKRLSKKRA